MCNGEEGLTHIYGVFVVEGPIIEPNGFFSDPEEAQAVAQMITASDPNIAVAVIRVPFNDSFKSVARAPWVVCYKNGQHVDGPECKQRYNSQFA